MALPKRKSPVGSLFEDFVSAVNSRVSVQDMGNIAAGRKSVADSRRAVDSKRNAEQQQATRRMANESNKTMATAPRSSEGSPKRPLPFTMEESPEELGLTPVELSRVGAREAQKRELDTIQGAAAPQEDANNLRLAAILQDELSPEQEAEFMKGATRGDAPKPTGPQKPMGMLAGMDANSIMDKASAKIAPAVKVPSPKIEEAAPSRDFNALFKTATGTDFDPKSRLDRARMAEIQSLVNSRSDLADKDDRKVALAWYASKRK
jgi:hypothetical protein